MTIEQVIARIERARNIYENAIDSDIVKGRVAMCNDIMDTLRLEAEFHPKQEQQKLPDGLEEAAYKYTNSEAAKSVGRAWLQRDVRLSFIAGAEWQKKQDDLDTADLALTWEDLQTIKNLFYQVDYEVMTPDIPLPHGQKFYEEVLRRFREMKNK